MKCSKLALIKDVSMQWNSTFAMLDRAIDINDANQSMCQNEPTLAAYTLEEDECLSGKAPRFALPVCHYGKDRIVQRRLQTGRCPLYNAMIDILEEFIEQEGDPSLEQAAIHGKTRLLGSYPKTDSTPVYTAATAMDLRMRLDCGGPMARTNIYKSARP